MNFFFWGIAILFALTAVYYVIFFSLVYYWHEKKTTFIILPFIYTFEFFIVGFFIIALVSLTLQYLPEIIKAIATG